MSATLLVVLGVLAFAAFYFIAVYNGLIKMKNRVDEADSDIDIQLVLHQDLINISIEDNGVGLNKNKIKKGIGLNNIEDRIKRLNGKFMIDCEAMKGTIINIEIPLGILK